MAGGPPVSRRVVVTGGAGFLGSHLCEALLAAG
ncbi:NAD-dependent epimerase/dehydratase family protein, partial [Enterococcus faecium]